MKLKYFHIDDPISVHLDGKRKAVTPSFTLVKGDPVRKPAMRKDRKGQSRFRNEILQNYGFKCCMSDDGVTELLEAAHIQPYVNETSNHPQNGLCLRVDLHRLFDDGLITITEDLTIQVSPRLGKTSYSGFSGKKIRPPASGDHYPALVAIKDRKTNEYRD